MKTLQINVNEAVQLDLLPYTLDTAPKGASRDVNGAYEDATPRLSGPGEIIQQGKILLISPTGPGIIQAFVNGELLIIQVDGAFPGVNNLLIGRKTWVPLVGAAPAIPSMGIVADGNDGAGLKPAVL